MIRSVGSPEVMIVLSIGPGDISTLAPWCKNRKDEF